MDILYGVNPVIEALRAGKRRCHELYIAAGRREAECRRLEEEARRRRVPVRSLPREEITALARSDKHQGAAARCDAFPYAPLESVVSAALAAAEKGFVVLLDGITDPQNLGSIVRSAHLMGVHGVILPRDNAAPVSPAVVKASAGATEHLPIVQVTNLAETIRSIKDRGFWVAGAEEESRDSVYLHDFQGHHVALVMGSEGRGLRRLVRERCDYLLSIPMKGVIQSYNASVAGALMMGEVSRQRWLKNSAKSVSKSG